MSSPIDTDNNTENRTIRKLIVSPGCSYLLHTPREFLPRIELLLGGEADTNDDDADVVLWSDLFLDTVAKTNDEERRVDKYIGLSTLALSYVNITSLPPSIGRLKNLKDLNLYKSKSLLELPKEIGDLASLIKLNLKCSSITSLPPSIGKLKNLKYLDLRFTDNLLELPEEIGDLASLSRLKLNNSKIKMLPTTIGRLQNLKELNLRHTYNLLQLPEEIGDLASLRTLGLVFRDEYGYVANLRTLGLACHWKEGTRGELQILFALVCHGARARIIQSNPKPKLWPLMLSIATRAFDDINTGPYRCYRVSSKPDAIYQLLVDGRESFLMLLGNRNEAHPYVPLSQGIQ